MELSWVGTIFDFHGAVVLQTNRFIYFFGCVKLVLSLINFHFQLKCVKVCDTILWAFSDSAGPKPGEWWVLWIRPGTRSLWICCSGSRSQSVLWRLPWIWKLPATPATGEIHTLSCFVSDGYVILEFPY